MHSGKKCLYRFLEVMILAMGLAALPAQTFSADAAPARDVPSYLRMAINRTIGSDQAAYHFKESGEGCFEARYAALAADVQVGPQGLTVRNGAGSWTLGASAFATSGNMPASVLPRQVAPNRVELDRGWAVEWVVNGPSGLEQGWDIPKRPSWAANKEELLIPLEQNGNLRAVAAEADGKAICVRDAQGREILRYAGLRVTDAAGRELPASFEMRPGNNALWIKVKDMGAAYPITIDPWVESAKLVATDKQQNDHLGYSVALSAAGKICAVGAYGSSPGGISQAGAVYIFTNAAGSWTGVSNQAAKLFASDGQLSDQLGWSVALSADGGICAAGAYGSAGAVYIFTNAAGSWAGVSSESAKLVASDKVQGDHLGNSVALSSNGEICAAGAFCSGQAGAVYVFKNTAGSWKGVSNQVTKLVSSDIQIADNLGYSVALSADGGICAAGAICTSPGGTNQAGSVYIFKNTAGNWAGVSNQVAKLFASDRQAGDYLGSSVALSADGGICAAGAPNSSPGGTNQAGAVYIFKNTAGSWTGVSNQVTRLFASSRQALDNLGYSVALSADGGVCAAGAPNSSASGTNQAGAVYIFTNTAGSWSGVSYQATNLFTSDRQAFDNFGFSVALSTNGDVCAAGAPDSSPGQTDKAGAAYVNVLPLPPPPPTETGWLGVLILPADIVAAGAQWRLDGGAWQTSWTLLTNVSAGTHTVSYSAVDSPYHSTPDDQQVTISPNQLTIVEGTYPGVKARWAVCADYDGDRFADPAEIEWLILQGGQAPILVMRLSSQAYALVYASVGSGAVNYYYASIGADFDGDGRGDIGYYNANASVWCAYLSTANYAELAMARFFGDAYCTGLAADFDGDRKADPAVYNPANGDWQILLSSQDYMKVTLPNLLGGTGWEAAAADVDGDKYADPYVRNMATGQCIALFSRYNYARVSTPEGFLPGEPGAQLALADYDGDGLADPAVFSLIRHELYIRFSRFGYNGGTVDIFGSSTGQSVSR